jgi:lysyl-tRNA synthetase class 2
MAAERFEVFYQGLELANGYHELCDADEQRARLVEANQMRQALKKETLPIDESFLQALEKGLPFCCGVAVGFDRLMMLRHHAEDIADVVP